MAARVDPHAVTRYADQLRREFLLRDLFTFAKFSGIAPDIEVEPYKEICDWLESRLPNRAIQRRKRGLFLIPRLFFKTTLISALCIYAYLKDPDIRIVLGRSSTALAEKTLRGIKTYTKLPTMLRTFGDLQDRFEKWTDENIVLRDQRGGTREPTIDTTGLNSSKTGAHVELAILDDLVNEDNYMSAAEMEGAWTKIQSFTPILERWGSLLVVGTRWGDNDVYGKIQDQDDARAEAGKDPMWDKFIHTCFDEREGHETEAWIPYVLSVAQIEELKETLQYDPKLFTAWYLNKAHADGDTLITLAYINYFDGEFVGGPFAELRLEDTDNNKVLIHRFETSLIPLAVCMLIDPALTIGPRSDFTGICVVGFDPLGNWWVLGAYEIKMRPEERLNYTLWLARRFAPQLVALENADMDGILLQERLRGIDGLSGCRVVSFDPRMDRRRITADPKLAPRGMHKKEAQIEKLEPILRAKRVFISRSETGPLVRQLLRYPHLDHDDVLDAFSMGQAYAANMVLHVADAPERVLEEVEKREFDLEGLNFDGSEKGEQIAVSRPNVPAGAWTGPFTSIGSS